MIPDKSPVHCGGGDSGYGLAVLHRSVQFYLRDLKSTCQKNIILHLDTPFEDYPEEIQDMLILHGTDGREVKVHYKGQRGEGVYDVAFEGLIQNVQRRYRETGSDTMKQEYEAFMRITPCETCKGQRLKAEFSGGDSCG